MKVNKIEVSLGRTINTGNYQSARVDVTMGAIIGEDELPLTASAELFSLVKAELDNRVKSGDY